MTGGSQVWKVFLRLPNAAEEYAPACHRANLIAIGWARHGSLLRYTQHEDLQRALRRRFGMGRRAAINTAASIWAFLHLMKKGDLVIAPDSIHGRHLVGVVQSDPWFEANPKDGVPFQHRRRVSWLKYRTGRVGGGIQTVARLESDAQRWKRAVKRLAQSKAVTTRRAAPRGTPDADWGRAAEERALRWLKQHGRNPKDVASQCLGWDIEDGDLKFEVKGRRTTATAIRLTENEFKAASKHRAKYTLLIFTAKTLTALRTAKPRQVPDPANSENWQLHVRTTREYFGVGL